MFKFCRRNKTIKNGIIKKQVSYMMAVSPTSDIIDSPNEIIKKLRNSRKFRVREAEIQKDLAISLKIESKGHIFDVRVSVENYELGDMCKIKHYLTEENYKDMIKNNVGITVAMTFNESNLESYHLQLQILCAVMDNAIAIIDFCSGKILSSKWAKLAANSKSPPSSQYLYSVQAASEENNYWLYTCGLNRCGFIEVEILKSNPKYYTKHARILKLIAQRMILTNTFIKEREQFFVGNLINGDDIFITWLNPKKALKSYNKNIIGGIKEREEIDDDYTGIVYVYQNKKRLKRNKYSHISTINKYLTDKLIVTHTEEEVRRTGSIALERFKYFTDGIKSNNVRGLVEIAFEIEELSTDKIRKYEHVWIEIEEVDKASACGTLIQNPYFIKYLKKGEKVNFLLEHLVDWVLYTPNGEITPDKIYLIEEENHYWFRKIFNL